MLTSFVLNQNNLLSEYATRSTQKRQQRTLDAQRISNYIHEQDTVIEQFERTLENNIVRAVLGAPELEKISLLTPIKNALWQLWNAGWMLGGTHANNKIQAIFSNSNDTDTTIFF